MSVEPFVIVQCGAKGILGADPHARKAQLTRQPHALEGLLGNLRDALARGGLLDLAGADIQMQPPDAGALRGVDILTHTAGVRGAEMEALQRAIAPLADRLERLADAEDTEALALQIIEQREQLGRLVILLVRRILVHQKRWDMLAWCGTVSFVQVDLLSWTR